MDRSRRARRNRCGRLWALGRDRTTSRGTHHRRRRAHRGVRLPRVPRSPRETSRVRTSASSACGAARSSTASRPSSPPGRRRPAAIVDWEGTRDLSGELADHMAGGRSTRHRDPAEPGVDATSSPTKDSWYRSTPSWTWTQVTRDYAPAWIDLGSHDGKLYGIFYKVTDKSTVWYNPKAFAAADYRVPATWDEMIALADTMVADGRTPFSIVRRERSSERLGTHGLDLGDRAQQLRAGSLRPVDRGRDPLEPTRASSSPSTCSPRSSRRRDTCSEAVSASSRRVTTSERTRCTPTRRRPTCTTSPRSPRPSSPRTTRTSNRATTTTSSGSRPSIPEYRGAVTVGADIPVMVSDTPAARSFMTYLAGAQAQEAWIKLGGFTSVNRSVSADAYLDPVARAVAEELTSGGGRPFQRRRHDALGSATGLVEGDARARPGSEQGGLDPRIAGRRRQARGIAAG